MTTSITIDGLDAAVVARLRAEARRLGVDLTQVARDALRRGLPLPSIDSGDAEYHDLDFLAGTWTEADAQEFTAAAADFDRIDPELWK
ncbi:MAG: hypothetical protein JWL69_461 [Phycisphaerales bacterium]|jgi:hypothetical protein|nr:hypothetical protein [Phycisphaerales bacterium]MDB5356961.1 hypothetical protein [Phycisphaerales bacterium]